MRGLICKGRLPAYALALLGALWMHPASGKLKYDPKSCKVDTEGRVFVQMRNQFMAIPIDQFGLAEPEHPDSLRKPTRVGDPSEPQGCPDNPIQTTRYLPHLRIVLPPQVPGSAPDPNWSLDRVELIYTEPEPVKGRPGIVWAGEEINLDSLERVCARATLRESLPDGLEACRVKQVDPKVKVEDWAATYTVAPEVYATPLGNKFVIYCGPDVYSGRISGCDVHYSLSQDVGLFYKFHPFGPGPHLALGRVIDLDKQMRSVIEGYVSDGRRWLRQ